MTPATALRLFLGSNAFSKYQNRERELLSNEWQDQRQGKMEGKSVNIRRYYFILAMPNKGLKELKRWYFLAWDKTADVNWPLMLLEHKSGRDWIWSRGPNHPP